MKSGGLRASARSPLLFLFRLTLWIVETRCYELYATLGICLDDLMFDDHLGFFLAEFLTASGTVETDLAIEMYFLTATSWAVYILAFRLSHLASLSLKIKCLSSTPYTLSAYLPRCHCVSYVSHTSVFSVAGSAMALQRVCTESAMVRMCI